MPVVHTLSQLTEHALCFLKIHFKVIPVPRSSKWSPSSRLVLIYTLKHIPYYSNMALFTVTGVAQLCLLQTCQRPGSFICRSAWQDIRLSTVKCFEWLPLQLPGENYEIQGKSTNQLSWDWVVKSSTCQILHALPLAGSWDIGSASFSPKASQSSHKSYLKV